MAVNKRLIGGAAAAGGITPSENFKVVTYTGTGSTQAITGVGFQPDFVWIKLRDVAENHWLTDSTRGVTKGLFSNLTNAETTRTNQIQSFDSDGFTLGADDLGYTNYNTRTYVAWCWKANGGTTSSNTDGSITSTVQANTDAGFSIVKYVGNQTAGATIGHNLGITPKMVIVKEIDSNSGWIIYHADLGNTKHLLFTSGAVTTSSAAWNNTSPNSSTVTLGNNVYTNQSGLNYIAYCFAPVDGFSKFGSYTGNGSSNIIETGFEPAFIMFKRTDASNNWLILDNKRNTSNPRNCLLIPNANSAEDCTDAAYNVNFLSNGFELLSNGTSINDSGGTYIYMAFAADPDREAPTLADSFAVETYTGDGTSNRQINTLGFKPGLFWQKTRATSSSCTYHNLFDIVRGGNKTIYSNATDAEVTNQGCGYIQSFDDYGVTYTGDASGINNNGENFVIWAWKADDNEPTIEGGAAKAVYKFEDNANDVTGNYNGTASNVSYSSSGKFNKAADFSTSGANIAIGSPIPNTDTAVSVSAWIYLNSSATSYETVIGAGVGTAGSEAPFRVNVRYVSANTYKIEALRQIGGTYHLTALSNYTDSTIAVETWHHLVWTYSPTGKTLTTYLNGSKVDTLSLSTSGSSVNDSTSVIGNFRTNTTTNFNGLIDQVRIYSGTLQDEQVSQLYAETSSDNDDLILGGPPETIISANANAGFSIVQYEGNGVTGTKIPHGLSAAPEMLIVKNLSNSHSGNAHWAVYHTSIGNTKVIYLNRSNAETTSSAFWNDTTPTSTVFSIGNDNDVNVNGEEFIAYCFHSVSGFSDIGSYSGNSTSGRLINIGFQPDWVMIKTRNATSNWFVIDSVRGGLKDLRPNSSNGDETRTNGLTFVSNGFEIDDTTVGFNNTGTNYIYMAFKMNKTLYPTSGNMSFLVIAGGGGAGGSDGGGGGAGGLRTSYRPTSGGGSSSESDITLAAGTYTITVGAAGTGGTGYSTTTPTSGADSSIAASGLTTITSDGGGRGGMYNHINGYPESGGSGGGAGGETGMVGFSGTANQGFDGEDGGGAGGTYHGGGGGGAAEAGGTDAAGQGGDGLSVSITGSAVTYAGGGAGGGLSGTTQGGAGGGGNSGVGSGDVNGSAGSTNTGSGGGAGADGSSSQGGAGGSGVVILRLLTSEYSGSTTGSPTVTTDGDYTIIKYTGSGTYVHS